METLIWSGVILCLAHSGMFSGLNLALLGLPRLRLEAEARSGSDAAERVLALRRDSNLLLTTLLWGNVGVNVLLTLLSESVLAGAGAFLFSTFGITLVGEIVPQAYFSRNALRVGARLAPLVRFYEILLYPIAKPTALALDRWLGPEAVQYYRERDLREVIELHAIADETDLGRAEAQGALNFLDLDDLRERELIDPRSVVTLDHPHRLPRFDRSAEDPFLRDVQASGQKWVVLVDRRGEPGVVVDADGFLRDALLGNPALAPGSHCHRPIVIRDPATRLGNVLRRLRVDPESPEDDVVDCNLVLLWTPDEQRVLTGADILGRLLRGITIRGSERAPPASVRDGA
jgi:metal transporter CNNM